MVARIVRLALVAFVAVALPGVRAAAELYDFGDPIEGGSWSQKFYENGLYGGKTHVIHQYKFFMELPIDGSIILAQMTSDTNGTTWATPVVGRTLVADRTAGNTAAFYFTLKFENAVTPPALDKSKPFRFYCDAFDSTGQWVGAQTSEWTGSGWKFAEVTQRKGYFLPEAGSLQFAAFAGLAGLGLILRRRRA